MIHSLVLVIIMSVMTMILRFFPFLVFSNNTPGPILYLGKVLSGSHGVAEVSATILVIVLHKWKHNTLLSILLGTLFYMFMVQVIF